ncbi:MAG: sauU 2 [Planctomycetaceae bacterium]|nr:sauU 2 [Planctomycetaceae bacterium]
MSQSLETTAERPTFVRYLVLLFLCTLAFIFYLDRICISKAVPKIMEELNLTKTDMGFVLAAFTLSYALFEVPIGWWGDRYGSRGVMARIVIGWSVFTALTGAVWGFSSLIAVRFLFGAGEAGAFPNTARILSRWLPLERRGMGQGLVNSMSQVGGAVAPLLTAYLMEWIGWRWTFVVFSIPGVIWAGVFYWWFRDDPQTHPAVNEAERKLIAAGTVAHDGATHPPIPWGLVVSAPQIWLMGAVLMCTAANSYFYYSWYPTYLEQGRGVTSIDSGRMSSIVLAGGAIGCICGGLLIDFLVKATGDRHRCRRVWGCTALILAAICLVIGKNCESAYVASYWTAGSLMFMVSTLAGWWGAVTDLSGRHLGALFGLMNSLGAVGAIASQLFVGPYTKWMESQGHTGSAQWDSLFYVYACVLIVGACGWLMVDSSHCIDRVE